MNCDDLDKMLANNGSLSSEARQHAAGCELCRELLEVLAIETRESVPHAPTEARLKAIASQDLKPVRPLASAWVYTAWLLGSSGIVILLAVLLLGRAGFSHSSVEQRFLLGLGIAGMFAALPPLLSTFMVPGSLAAFSARTTLWIGVAVFGCAALLYPFRMYPAFASSTFKCLLIGLSFSAVTGLSAWLVMRRGLILEPFPAALATGQFAGLTALAIQVVYCPHLDILHYSLAHFGAYVLSAIGGFLLAWRFREPIAAGRRGCE